VRTPKDATENHTLMAKGKTRASSQRNGNGSRSKSSSANGSFAGGGGGGGDYDDDNTITDSFTMGSLASAYEEGYNEGMCLLS
jgi:hypothetical protein